MAKKLEFTFKKIFCGPTISAIPPDNYSKRFVDFIEKLIEIEEDSPQKLLN